MSIQNVNSSTAALNAQLLQQEQQSGNSSFSSQDLPQLSTNQVQSLQQALQTDVQQALSGSAGGGNFQTQLDSSVSNSLSQAGFSQSQIQSVIDKLNQGANGSSSTQKHGHGGHHARRVLNSLVQTLNSNASGQSSTSSSGSTGTATSSSTTLLDAVTNTSSTTSGQSLDVTA
jgi:hypothetical protein